MSNNITTPSDFAESPAGPSNLPKIDGTLTSSHQASRRSGNPVTHRGHDTQETTASSQTLTSQPTVGLRAHSRVTSNRDLTTELAHNLTTGSPILATPITPTSAKTDRIASVGYNSIRNMPSFKKNLETTLEEREESVDDSLHSLPGKFRSGDDSEESGDDSPDAANLSTDSAKDSVIQKEKGKANTKERKKVFITLEPMALEDIRQAFRDEAIRGHARNPSMPKDVPDDVMAKLLESHPAVRLQLWRDFIEVDKLPDLSASTPGEFEDSVGKNTFEWYFSMVTMADEVNLLQEEVARLNNSSNLTVEAHRKAISNKNSVIAQHITHKQKLKDNAEQQIGALEEKYAKAKRAKSEYKAKLRQIEQVSISDQSVMVSKESRIVKLNKKVRDLEEQLHQFSTGQRTTLPRQEKPAPSRRDRAQNSRKDNSTSRGRVDAARGSPDDDDESSSSSDDSDDDNDSVGTGYGPKNKSKKSNKQPPGIIRIPKGGLIHQGFDSIFVGDPRYPDPPHFHGEDDIDNYESWTLSLQSKLRHCERSFPDSWSQVEYARDRTKGLANQIIRSRANPRAANPYTDINELLEDLDANFLPQNQKVDAHARVADPSFKMKPKETFNEFMARFSSVIAPIQLKADYEMLFTYLTRNLTMELAREASRGPVGETYEQLVSRLRRFDNAERTLVQQPSSRNAATKATRDREPRERAAKPTREKKKSSKFDTPRRPAELWEQLQKENRCAHCGKTGHRHYSANKPCEGTVAISDKDLTIKSFELCQIALDYELFDGDDGDLQPEDIDLLGPLN
jgi:hypothetical protein